MPITTVRFVTFDLVEARTPIILPRFSSSTADTVSAAEQLPVVPTQLICTLTLLPDTVTWPTDSVGPDDFPDPPPEPPEPEPVPDPEPPEPEPVPDPPEPELETDAVKDPEPLLELWPESPAYVAATA